MYCFLQEPAIYTTNEAGTVGEKTMSDISIALLSPSFLPRSRRLSAATNCVCRRMGTTVELASSIVAWVTHLWPLNHGIWVIPHTTQMLQCLPFKWTLHSRKVGGKSYTGHLKSIFLYSVSFSIRKQEHDEPRERRKKGKAFHFCALIGFSCTREWTSVLPCCTSSLKLYNWFWLVEKLFQKHIFNGWRSSWNVHAMSI